jgi:hypothetical protein
MLINPAIICEPSKSDRFTLKLTFTILPSLLLPKADVASLESESNSDDDSDEQSSSGAGGTHSDKDNDLNLPNAAETADSWGTTDIVDPGVNPAVVYGVGFVAYTLQYCRLTEHAGTSSAECLKFLIHPGPATLRAPMQHSSSFPRALKSPNHSLYIASRPAHDT